jgi:prophage regulatory protein
LSGAAVFIPSLIASHGTSRTSRDGTLSVSQLRGVHVVRLPEKLIRRPAVLDRTGLASATLDRLVASGGFPVPVRTSPATVAWRQSEVEKWIWTRPRAVRGSINQPEVSQ